MRLSARNQLRGTVDSIQDGAVTSIVKVKVGDQIVTASVTKEAVEDLALAEGAPVVVLIKSSDVLLGVDS